MFITCVETIFVTAGLKIMILVISQVKFFKPNNFDYLILFLLEYFN